jgi:hypothetical protein
LFFSSIIADAAILGSPESSGRMNKYPATTDTPAFHDKETEVEQRRERSPRTDVALKP